jgi:hypothetical protein
MTDERARPLLIRLEAVLRRLADLADQPAPAGLTDPDPGTDERWEWGQVWGHVAEFPGYWVGVLRRILAVKSDDPPAFGRVKSDPARIAAIERDRTVPARDLMDRVRLQAADLRDLITQMSPEDWSRAVSHPTLGILGMDRVMEEFLVGHLESHAEQLDSLVEGGEEEEGS